VTSRARWRQGVGAASVGAGALALAALQYVMPAGARYPGPIYPAGAQDYARFLVGTTPVAIPTQAFVVLFQSLVILMWFSYALLVYAAYRDGLARPGRFLAGAALLALALAVAFPTSLTHDLFAYLGFGRMWPVYGANPYATTLEHLAGLGDAAAARYPAPHPSVYGPLWTLLTSAIAWVARGLPLMAQAMLLKIVAACALVGGAMAARAVALPAGRRWGDLAMVAFAFNPLLLIEGPASGHNDLLMVALLVAGLALVAQRHPRIGFLVVGLSVAVKFVTVAIVPLLLVRELKGKRLRAALREGAALSGLSALPVIALGAPFLIGADPLTGIAMLFGARASTGGGTVLHVGLLAVLYVMALVWLLRDSQEPGRFTTAWVAWSAMSLHFAFPGTLPWYLSWPAGVAVTQWDRRSVAITCAVMLLALRWMLYYVALR
jgi:hypothetical protein